VNVKRVDVAVVGAGPAGSMLAALLASRGASVVLVDRDAFPRDKVCGEFLSYDALPLLPDPVRTAIEIAEAPRIERCRVIGRHRTLEFPLPAQARGVSRFFFDDLLVKHALGAGVELLERYSATDLKPSAHVLTVEADGVQTRIEARAIAGAWGRWGRFDQRLGRAFVTDRRTRSFGFKRHYVANALPPASDSIDLYSFAHGYLGVNRVEGNVTNICGLVHGDRLSGHKGRWDSFVDSLRGEEPPLDALYAAYTPADETFLTSEPVIFRARRAVEQGVFMVGDASGIVDPLTGNGMAMAIQSACLAAPAILESLASPGRRATIEDAYVASHHRLFASRIRWSRTIAALLARPVALERAIALAGHPAIGALLTRRTRATERQVAELRRVACER
jgi:flavin-dependent dehydrogenase